MTINFMLPGAFDTDRLRSNIEANAKNQGISVEAARTARVHTIPAKRFGETAEFGATCVFLCSAHAGFITGQKFLIDGGAYPGTF
jgi:3-oxoacyl-[acyl-carrier protein] reductase